MSHHHVVGARAITAPLRAFGVAIALACGGDGLAEAGGSPGAVTRDSAGVEIVESTAEAWTPETQWTIDARPIVDLGASPSDTTQQFTIVRGVHRLSSGAIAVFDAGSFAIRFYDSTGTLLGSAGRQGTGPGEFPRRGTGQSFICGDDTVFVTVENRMVAFAPPGEYVREFTLPRVQGLGVAPAACHGDRFLGRFRASAIPTEEGVHRDSAGLALVDRQGRLVAVVDTVGWWDRSWVRFGSQMGAGPAPFGRHASVAMGPPGVALTTGDRFEIELRDTSGALRRLVRAAGRERPLTDADLQAFRDIVMPIMRQYGDDARILERQLSRESLPATRPAIAAVRFDSQGNLWVRAYDMTDATDFYEGRLDRAHSIREPNRRWTVLDANGRLLGDVALPTRFDIHQIGDDWILGVGRDSLDVEHVRLYRLRKPAS